MPETRVAIIDSAKSRRERFVEVLLASGVSAANVRECWSGCYPDSDETIQCDLLFIHHGDRDALANRTDVGTARAIIYYGGAGEPDPRWGQRQKNKNDMRIWRIVSPDGAGVLTVDEMKQLLEYCGSSVDAGSTAKPEFLEAPTECSSLLALSILCQGCLAVVNPEALGNPKGFVKDEAIVSWAKDEVQSPSWWLDVLDPDGKAKESSGLVEFGKEWPKPSDGPMVAHWTKMDEFLNGLLTTREEKKTLEPAKLAALAEQTYVAIKARLESLETAGKA